MIYEGSTLSVRPLDGGIAELCLDNKQESINKFNQVTLKELEGALTALETTPGITGLLVTSNKSVFVAGADITEFIPMFKAPPEVLKNYIIFANTLFNRLEDLPFPSISAINGAALGGGFELALSTDLRVAATGIKVGLPEVKLGIIPGFGGTTRLPRLIGPDNAVEWIASGSEQKPEDGLKVGAIDAVVAPEKLRGAVHTMLELAIAGKLDWQARRAQKKGALRLSFIEAAMSFETCKGFVAGQAGPNMPAPLTAVKCMEKAQGLERDEALKVEHEAFVKVAKTPAAQALVGIFLNDQVIKKVAGKTAKKSRPVKSAGVLGAGIMGGGIAYQSASRGIPVIMKDIRPEALELGMSEASKLLIKQVERGKLDTASMARVVASISPRLSYDGMDHVDIVVEAVVENLWVKQKVLAEVESKLKDTAVLCSNTSTISISTLAEGLARPASFVGMHFFNPVHRMPLVEVIRGRASSDEAIATAVAFASAMGKSPIVVNDCPGFFVNRVLFPYFEGFARLLRDGVDFKFIDKTMEKFGWPMGPAYLLDVVGIDTAHHAAQVMADGFPDRMNKPDGDPVDLMYKAGRFGQKNGKGFYLYTTDPKGRPKKDSDAAAYELLSHMNARPQEVSPEAVVDRMMIPMLNETVRCLSEGIIATPAEADMALVYGLGFPPFRGGAIQYLESLGVATFLAKCEQYAELGPLYAPLDAVRDLVRSGKTFYSA